MYKSIILSKDLYYVQKHFSTKRVNQKQLRSI